MLQLWRPRTLCQRLLEPGKHERGCSEPSSRECPPSIEDAHITDSCITEHLPTLAAHIKHTPKVAKVTGTINSHPTTILLDSGASCSVICGRDIPVTDLQPLHGVQLVNADGRHIFPSGTSVMSVSLGNLQAEHTFMVLDDLSTPVNLGCDFLMKYNVIIDFGKAIAYCTTPPGFHLKLQTAGTVPCNKLTLDDELPQAIPTTANCSQPPSFDLPTDVHPSLRNIITDHKLLFSEQLGKTNVTNHVIDTGNAIPVRVPPRPIPFHYAEKVHNQLQEMAQEGIIRPSNSPWCAPAVYVPKSNGELRICIDFVQMNRVTKKDSYPVPRAEGPQLKLAGKRIFSKLDLRSAYWQFPMHSHSIEKTAFCPGPGYGLWEFTVMPYGLTGATQTCQWGLDTVLQNCKYCVDNYVDDCIVYSDDMQSHITDLRKVLGQLMEAGFTLRGSKCSFGMSTVSHLGFQYSSTGVTPSPERTQAVANWPPPKSTKELRSFLGLANFYRRFVNKFADIAAPLTHLTSNKVPFSWTSKHQQAFDTLCNALVSPPILDYPTTTDQFILSTDASDLGLGAVLSTGRGTVIEYASRTLSPAELKYSTTEKECLAIVWAVSKLRHYLLGTSFILETDHKPLLWLESAKASHARSQRLERWSLELQAYNFTVRHRPGIENTHADSLSRLPVSLVALEPSFAAQQLSQAQRDDLVLSVVINRLENNSDTANSRQRNKFPLRRYQQLWSQLSLQEVVLCREVKSPTMIEQKLLVVVPSSLHPQFLQIAHDKARHQGADRTLSQLSQIAYWVGISKDVSRYCSVCPKCQYTKAPMAQPAPLQPVIASKLWELVAVDILKVPMSSSGNQYILVAQDYFSKWPFARAMPDQKADRIVKILRDEVFTLVGPPCKLHSDQGQNFESHILSDLCKAFHVAKSHTTPYHPMGDGLVERMNRSLLSLLRSFVEKEGDWEQHLQFLLYIYRTSKHSSTGLSPFEIIFGSNPPSLHIPDFRTTAILDPGDYVSGLQQKLMELRELVDASLVESASKQEHFYNSSQLPQFKKGQKVLLNNPTKGKLDPRWTGPWVVQHQNNTTLRIKKGSRDQTVHVNWVRPLLEREEADVECADWSPPLFHHHSQEGPTESLEAPEDTGTSEVPGGSTGSSGQQLPTTRSGRVVRPVEYYGYDN